MYACRERSTLWAAVRPRLPYAVGRSGHAVRQRLPYAVGVDRVLSRKKRGDNCNTNTTMKILLLILAFLAASARAQLAAAMLWNITYSQGFSGSDELVIIKAPSPVLHPYSLISIQFNYLKFPLTNNYTIIDQLLPVQFTPYWGPHPPVCETNMSPGSLDGGQWFQVPFVYDEYLTTTWVLIRCDRRIEIWPPTGPGTFFAEIPTASSGFVGGGLRFVSAS
jgi:hypothetical protein